MAGRLENKVAVITGAGTGIGEAIAHKFAYEGAKVVVVGLSSDPVQDVAAAIQKDGGEAVFVSGDVSEESHAQAAVQAAIDKYGRLDILVNNAGVFLDQAEIEKYPIEDFDKTVKNNLRSAFLMTKFAIPHLQKTRGNVVSAGSEAGFNGQPDNAPYGGSKAFLHSFMMGVAVEQAKHGVRANCVCPGAIDTALTRKETGPLDKKHEQNTVNAEAVGRRGTPEEIANVYAFIASDEASYVTGALWLADGGVTPAKGAVGADVPWLLKREPKGDLDLEHSHDGEKNKQVHVVK